MYLFVVQVPWKTFATRPSSVHISGVTIVLEPLGSANYDDAVEQALRDAVFAKKQVCDFETTFRAGRYYLGSNRYEHRERAVRVAH